MMIAFDDDDELCCFEIKANIIIIKAKQPSSKQPKLLLTNKII